MAPRLRPRFRATLPTLKEHLDRIEEISKSMKRSPASKSASK